MITMDAPDENLGAGPGIPADAIAAHLVRRVPRAGPDETAGGVRSRLLGATFDSAVDVAVGPLATVVQDLLSLLIYFTVAGAIVT